MKVTMTNAEVIQTINRLTEVHAREQETGEAKFPVRVSFAITKNLKMLEGLYAPYATEKDRIDSQYLEEDCLNELKGNPQAERVFKKGYKEADYVAALKELLDTENEVEVHKISIEDVEKCDRLTLADQNAIFFMIED